MVYFKLALISDVEALKDQTDFPNRVLSQISDYSLGSLSQILYAHIYIDHTALGKQLFGDQSHYRIPMAYLLSVQVESRYKSPLHKAYLFI